MVIYMLYIQQNAKITFSSGRSMCRSQDESVFVGLVCVYQCGPGLAKKFVTKKVDIFGSKNYRMLARACLALEDCCQRAVLEDCCLQID